MANVLSKGHALGIFALYREKHISRAVVLCG